MKKKYIHANADNETIANLSSSITKGLKIANEIQEEYSNIDIKALEMLTQAIDNFEKNSIKLNILVEIQEDTLPVPHLDIGGSGEMIIYKMFNNKMTIIDLNIDKEIFNKRAQTYEMDAAKMIFDNYSFSTVTSFFTLMYIDVRKLELIFKEIYRVLKVGGSFLIWDLIVKSEINESIIASIDIIGKKKKLHADFSSNSVTEVRDEKFYITLFEKAMFKNINVEIENNLIKIQGIK